MCKAFTITSYFPDFGYSGKEIKYDHFTFSGGEECVILKDCDSIERDTVIIEARLKSSKDVMCLLMITDAIRRRGVKHIELVLKYVPYARQDRVCNQGEALSIKVFADLINSQNYDYVRIWDPHSDVCSALINNVVVYEQYEEALHAVHKGDVIISPDAGSLKKCLKLAKVTGNKVVVAEKIRDVATGKILSTEVRCESLVDKDTIIIDDICDGGATFIELAKVLRGLGAKSVKLYVTHGIFSKGTKVFEGLIDKIYTTDSFYEGENTDLIKVL